ncbi:hypothetical protein P3W83_44160 [Cupriavidus basilensis]|nr:hypothetical protein [Cupriavidus basilensis]MDF3889367.1 hypothetical protein [Cupriavidus basilensis]
METVSSTEAATDVRGVEPKNRNNRGESDRNMIHSARNLDCASLGKKEIVSKIKDLRSLFKVRFANNSTLQKKQRIHHMTRAARPTWTVVIPQRIALLARSSAPSEPTGPQPAHA